jgi:hypothetical protein
MQPSKRARYRRKLVIAAVSMAVSPALFASALMRLMPVPVLQLASADKPEFEAASVRQDDSDQQETPSFPFTSDDSYPAPVTLLRADFTLDTYIAFAYQAVGNSFAQVRSGSGQYCKTTRGLGQARTTPPRPKKKTASNQHSLTSCNSFFNAESLELYARGVVEGRYCMAISENRLAFRQGVPTV